MLYFVIPTINGEIFGFPSVYSNLDKMYKEVNYECTIYKIDTINLLISEFYYNF